MKWICSIRTFFDFNLPNEKKNNRFNLKVNNMNAKLKNALGIALVAVVSAGSAVGANSYLMNKKIDSMYSEGEFKQPLHYTSYDGLPADAPDFTVAAENAVHGVVHIQVTSSSSSSGDAQYFDPFEFFFGEGGGFQRQQPQARVASGSGVIISTDGYIITNNHVVEDADEIEVTLNDNRKFKAKVIGTDPTTDIALIKISAENLPTIPFGDSEKLKVGEWVLAVGNPFNLNSTVTAGIVSAKGRGISGGTSKIESFIQTDAAVNPGNSGGALVNTKGELVGINTAIYSQTGNFTGYSFAVPISIASKVASDLKKYGAVQRAILGVQITDPENVKGEDKDKVKALEGAYVSSFAERSPAKEAGIEKGDVITAVNGTKVTNVNSLQEQVSKYRPGDKVEITVNRDGVIKKYNVELRNAQGGTQVVKGGDSTEVMGAALTALTKKQKEEMSVSYGIQVTGLTDGKMKTAGIKKDFVIMEVNSQKMSDPEDFYRIVDGILHGNSSEQGLFIKGFYPNGRTSYYAIDLSQQ